MVINETKAGQWISVDDQLPINTNDVLIAQFGSCGENEGMVKGWFSGGVWHISTDGISASNFDGYATITLDMNVTHWMPIPEFSSSCEDF